jgi:hypothetical protein
VALRERSDAGGPVEVDAATPARSNGDRRRGSDPAAELQRANEERQRANARLERANAELWRENRRLARAALGQSDAAAATQLLRSERDLRPQLGDAQARIDRLERLLATPRHRAVERVRTATMRSRPVYWLVRRAWAVVARSQRR